MIPQSKTQLKLNKHKHINKDLEIAIFHLENAIRIAKQIDEQADANAMKDTINQINVIKGRYGQ
jgi:hypothetical protein